MGRLFLDSNVLIKGFVAPWSFDRVVLKYCAARLHQMVYAEPVKIEVERFLLNYSDSHGADWLLEDYDRFKSIARHVNTIRLSSGPKKACALSRKLTHVFRIFSPTNTIAAAL